ncbi:MAG TPA: hypothetical protein VGN49_03720 [Micrococcaceae bacterium]|jgi:hypothetical protein|nr:hypothetical protein [Micrococcaceae bacterium]
MSVPAKAFQQWLHAVAPGSSMATVAALAGIKRSTLAQQLVRGKVAISTVVALSRAQNLDVVTALSGFERFTDLAQGVKPPTQPELVSQLSDMDLLRQILARNAEGAPTRAPAKAPAQEIDPLPHKTSVRCWIEAVDSGNLRQRLAGNLRMAPQNLSAQLSANRLPPAAAVEAARIAGVGLTNGLVATGLLTPQEARWPPNAREDALRGLPDTELVTTAAARLEMLGKTLRRIDQDNEQTKAIWENLG